MKFKLTSITLLLIILVSTGCDRKLFDYRRKFTGDYEVTVINEGMDYVSSWEPYSYSHTTVYSNAKVSIDESTEDGIIIKLNPNNIWGGTIIDMTMGKNGIIDQCAINGMFNSKKDFSMSLSNWGHCNSYSAGGHSKQTLTGKKN